MALDRVEIIGCALEPYREDTSMSAEEMGFLLARQAREAAGVTRGEITSIHNSTMDLFDGITISNGLLQPAAGGYGRDSTRIQNGGVFALVSAYAAIASRSSSVAVVSSVDAVKTDTLAVSAFSSHPFFDQPLHLNALTSYALLSRSLQHEKDLGPELSARIASRNYRSGAENPAAHIRRRYSTENVLSSEVVASPLRRLEVSLISSTGGAALILAGAKRARKDSSPPVWIKGIGMSTSGIRHEQQVQLTAVREASRRAYEMAAIDDPFA